jgi:hypothetical protein
MIEISTLNEGLGGEICISVILSAKEISPEEVVKMAS